MADELQIGGAEGFTESPARKEAREKELAKGAQKSQTEANKTLSAAGLQAKTRDLSQQITNLQTAGGELDFDGPPVEPTDLVPDAEGAKAGAEAQLGTLDQLMKMYEEQQKQMAQQQEQQKGFMDRFLNREKTDVQQQYQTGREQALTEMGLTPQDIQQIGSLIGKVTAINQEIVDLKAKKEQDIIQAGGELMSVAAIRGEKRRRALMWNSEIASKEAEAGVAAMRLQLLQGANDDAKATAWKMVDVLTQDERQKVADMKWVYSTQQDTLNRLDASSRDTFNKIYSEAVREEENARKDYNQKLNLIYDAYNAGIDPGLTIDQIKTMSLEEMTQTVGPRIAERVRAQEAAGERETPHTRTVDGELYEYNFETGDWEKVIEGEGEPTIEDIHNAIESASRAYMEEGYSQEEIIAQVKKEYGYKQDEELPAPMLNAVKRAFGEEVKEEGGWKSWLKEEVWRRVPGVK